MLVVLYQLTASINHPFDCRQSCLSIQFYCKPFAIHRVFNLGGIIMQLTKPTLVFLGLTLLMSHAVSDAKPLTIQTSAQGIEYLTGGIGADEAELLDAYVDQFSLRLLFSQGLCGHAITNVNVLIYDAKKNVIFQLAEADPQLLVNLSKGSYRVIAEHDGLEQGSRFTLTDTSHKKVVLHWKDCVDIEEGDEAH